MFDLFGRKKISELTQQVDELNDQLEAKEDSLTELIEKTASATRELEKATDVIKEMQAVVDGLTQHNALLDIQSKRLVGSVANYEADNKGLRNTIESLYADIRELIDENERLKPKKRKKAKVKKKAKKN